MKARNNEIAKSAPSVERVLSLLSVYRVPLTSEKVTQQAIADELSRVGIEFEREFRLSAHDIPDFRIGDIFIEVKLGGSRRGIYKQCVRYCGYDAVRQLIVATNLVLGFPDSINGKSVWLFNLGKSWL